MGRDLPDGCPGPALCPLYVLSHHTATLHLGCVGGRELHEPCAGAESPEAFDRLFGKATTAIFDAWRARNPPRQQEESP